MKNDTRGTRLIFLLVLVSAFVGASFVSGYSAQAQEQKKEVQPPPAVVSDEAAKKAEEEVANKVSEVSQKAEAAAKLPAATVQAPEQVAPTQPGNVTVNFKSADIRTVLSYLSEVSGVDIVPAPEVKGLIDLKLSNKPWKTALDVIVRNYGFAYEVEGDIIRVVTLDRLKGEELATQAFTLNYGKAKDIVGAIKEIVSARGKMMYDDRTNIVLVTDSPTTIYKVGEIIKRLDKRTEQVLIEARVIETTLGNDEKMGIDWTARIIASGAKKPMTWPFDYYSDNKNFLDKYTPLVQSGVTVTTSAAGGQTVSTPPGLFPNGADGSGQGSKGFPFVDFTQDVFKDSFTYGTLDFSQFRAVLELIKKRSDTNVVSNPRIATLNNIEASILVGETLSMPKYERNSTTGKMEITGYQPQDYGIRMRVTPHINDNGEIIVDLIPEITDLVEMVVLDPSSGIVAPKSTVRQAKTQVMIKNGDTIFIGGLIREVTKDVNSKLPFLGDAFGNVPYLGLLVSHKDKVKEKRELIFFITVNLVTTGANPQIESIPNAAKIPAPEFTITKQVDESAAKKPVAKKKSKKWF